MKSIDILTVKNTIENYLESVDMPMELKRMIVKDVYEKTERKAYNEAMEEVNKMEKEKSDVIKV